MTSEVSFCWKDISAATKPGLLGGKSRQILDGGKSLLHTWLGPYDELARANISVIVEFCC